MKQPTVSSKNIILLCLLSLMLFALSYSLAHAAEKSLIDAVPLQNMAKQTQLGFYDLLSDKQEIYDIDIRPTYSDNYIASLTLQTDPNFILKGNITLTPSDSHDYSHLNFTPIHYQNQETNRMLHSLIDYTTYNDILIHDLKVNSNQLIVSHLGILILMPEVFSLPK